MATQPFPHTASSTLKPLAKSGTFTSDLLNCFRSVHLAILLISLLALGTLIGTVMPQEGNIEVAQIQQQYGTNYAFWKALGCFNVFSSFWFITLQVLFFFNLLIGSFKWLKPATLAAIHKTPLSAEMLIHKPEVFSLPQTVSEPLSTVIPRFRKILRKHHFSVYQDALGNLYASKGNITRLGPSISHIGILLCLIAGVYSCFYGFKAVRMAIPGETFTIPQSNTFKTNVPTSVWQGHVPTWKVHVKDFQVTFYPDHPDTAKQYTSSVDVVSPEGRVLKSQEVSVNHPLLYDNVSIYQASFAPTGRFLLRVNGQPQIAEINQQFNGRSISILPQSDGSLMMMFPFFAQRDPGVTKNYAVFMVRRPGEKMQRGVMPAIVKVEEGSTGRLKGKTISYLRPEMSTGLQIKRAPEVPLMYLSYLIIMVGAALCFFSQRQLFIAFRPVDEAGTRFEVMLHPKTNKGRLSYRKELFQLQEALAKALNAPQSLKPEASRG